ncbi:MAG: hypothetical protein JSS65_15305 [Armatimonadetes bacterium]|nr:hypothetical protein [Armatimonadota bacterium]
MPVAGPTLFLAEALTLLAVVFIVAGSQKLNTKAWSIAAVIVNCLVLHVYINQHAWALA